MDPFKLLREAIAAVPAVKFALGVAGIAAVVAIVFGLKLNAQVAVFGTIIVLGLMFILVLFSQYAGSTAGSPSPLFGPVKFLVWFYTVALALTTLLFISSYFLHLPPYPFPPEDDQTRIHLLAEASDLETSPPQSPNAWTAFASDYSQLGDIAQEYVKYIQGDSKKDRDNKIFHAIQNAAEEVRKRNENQTHWFENPDTGWHSKVVPEIFGTLLQAIHRHKVIDGGVASDRESCVEEGIQRWTYVAGIRDSVPSLPDDNCLSYLRLQKWELTRGSGQ